MAGTIMYAMGWTQHTTGTQNIRTMAIIQLLLGNMGVAGGGVNALRGESNVQGSTDHCLLWHIWPGYLKTARASNTTLAAYNQKWTPASKDPLSANWWQNYPKYSVSMLKSFFGERPMRATSSAINGCPRSMTVPLLLVRPLRCHVQGEAQGIFRLGSESGLQRCQCQ
jgi:formate dehydrogenase major subunit